MEYGKIIAVTGMPGLYELLSSKTDGAIVRSLEDKSSKFVSSRIHNFSHLESIEVFTVKDNVNLVDIFKAMEAEGGTIPDGKDGGALKKYFEKIYPDLDFERVYSSDLKKMVKWYDVLKSNNVEIKLTERVEEEEELDEVEEAPAQEAPKAAAEAPKKKAKTKEAEPGIEEEKPKKAAAKKTTERKQPDATSGVDEANKKEKKAPAKKSAPKKK
ncbi:MAG: hypothetical protein EOO01_08075 [Chitinophagaceae bacterium]|nr:MAG: hypothetical protein EOO01_08075 [Chitinophagaceae bacterium]